MKIQKKEVRLSPNHPSLLLSLTPKNLEFVSPLVINREGILVDGYRRYLLQEQSEIEVFQIQTTEVFLPALELNQHSRIWDEADCILWMRWARSLGINDPPIPIRQFPAAILEADVDLYQYIAQRRLTPRQVQLLLNAPPRYQKIFTDLLTKEVELNANETRDLIEMASELANSSPKRDLEGILE